MDLLTQRVGEIRERIAAAAARSGRPADAVTLVAAAKTRTAAEIDAALAAGVDEVGHNYVQEARATRPNVAHRARWRLIGPLQRNKIGQALGVFDSIDTVASLPLAEALNRRQSAEPLQILLEIHLGDEATKSGVAPDRAEELLAALQLMPGLACHGLMTMPPPAPPDEARRWFAQLRELAGQLRVVSGLALPILSMGMSADFELAIEEGATHVRLGTVLFGPRGAL